MKKLLCLVPLITSLGLVPAFAQFGSPAGGQGPHIGGAMDKLFGANQMFSANLEIETGGPSGDITMPGKFSFDAGKSRFEMNMSEVKGTPMPAAIVQQMKSMGMDTVISISRPDEKLGYMVYPGLNSYAQVSSQESPDSTNLDDYKVETTELGKETIEGHDCVKNKITVTDKAGAQHEFTVWSAGDLKNFPLKISSTEAGQSATMAFKDVSIAKPAASLFEPPAGLTKYDNVQNMIQSEMMKKMGGMAPPPAQH